MEAAFHPPHQGQPLAGPVVPARRRLSHPGRHIATRAFSLVVAHHQAVQAIEAAAAVVGAQVSTVKVQDERRRQRWIGCIGSRRGRVKLVASAEERYRPTIARIASVEAKLVVPVRKRNLVGGQAQNQARIAIATSRGQRRAYLWNGLADQAARLHEIHVQVNQVLVRARPMGATVDDAAGVAAIQHGRPAGIELDLVDELGVDHAGPNQQVVQQRHACAVKQKAGGIGAGATDHREREQRHDGRCTRQRLDDTEGIAERARNLFDLGAAQGDARHFLAVLLSHNDDLVGIVALSLDVVADREFLLRRQVLLLQESVVARSVRGDARVARRHRQPESSLGIGLHAVVALADQRDHGGAGHGQTGSHFDQTTTQCRGQRRTCVHRRRRWWWRWRLEGVRECDLDRHGLAAIARGLESETLGCSHHRVVEHWQGMAEQFNLGDRAIGCNHDLDAHHDGLIVRRSTCWIGHGGRDQRLGRLQFRGRRGRRLGKAGFAASRPVGGC